MRRPSWQLIAAAILLVLLAVLGTLQYRWLGEVSTAERDRLRTGLRTRASDISQEFDREIARTYVAFQFDHGTFRRDPAGVLSDALARAQKESSVGGIVRGVYVSDVADANAGTLRQLDPGARTLAKVEWPEALQPLRARAGHSRIIFSGGGAGVLPPAFTGDVVAAAIPALVVPIAVLRPAPGAIVFATPPPPPPPPGRTDARAAVLPEPASAPSIILWLDADRLRDTLLAPLVARHFGTAANSEYAVRVVSRADPAQVIYSSSGLATPTPESADVSTGLFDLRITEVGRLATAAVPPGGGTLLSRRPDGPLVKDRMEITIVRRATAGETQRVLMTGAEDGGAWRLLIGYKAGSLDTLVAASRRRNVAISLGVLGLLAGSFVLVMVSADRQRRLAHQQMEFVAAVSHELRTPLAVICSAGENLADGVVADGEQIKQYGRLVETEGRRLGDMVERVLAFAGISSGAATHTRADVDIAKVIGEAVGGVSHDARERGVTVNVHANGAPPMITGDIDALRSAVQNIVANAVKYSPCGATVDVRTDVANDATVRIRVTDHGFGIDAGDLPHIFKPFYRGRRAVDAQVRGTGIGLSVVRHVVDAHGGDIRVESRVGEGTSVTVALPLKSDDGGPRVIRYTPETGSTS